MRGDGFRQTRSLTRLLCFFIIFFFSPLFLRPRLMRRLQQAQHLHLPRRALARTLQRPAVLEVEQHAVGHLLAFGIGGKRREEIGKVVALDETLGLEGRG